jgi:hypothetical protein
MREEEMEGCASSLGDDGPEQVPERLAADEEDERLVLVWRPHLNARQEKRGEPDGQGSDSERVPVLANELDDALRAQSSAA